MTSLLQNIQICSRAHPALDNTGLCTRGKWPGCEVNHTPPSSVNVKNECSHTSGSWYVQREHDNTVSSSNNNGPCNDRWMWSIWCSVTVTCLSWYETCTLQKEDTSVTAWTNLLSTINVSGKLIPLLSCHKVCTRQNCMANHWHCLKNPANGETWMQEVKTWWGKLVWENQRLKCSINMKTFALLFSGTPSVLLDEICHGVWMTQNAGRRLLSLLLHIPFIWY